MALAKHIGAARFAYNWGLARLKEALEQSRPLPSAIRLHKEWNRWKRENAPWWVEVSKCAPQEAFRDLEKALKAWREGRANFPRFKRKKSLDDNKARLTGSIRVTPRHVQLLRIGKVRTKERKLIQAGKARILSATISREADRWFLSLTCVVERPDPEPKEVRGPEDIVGIDLGLEAFAVLSDGTKVEAPKPLKKALRLLERRSRQLSRKQKHSSLRLARLHRRVRNIRRDFLHKLTTWLAKTKSVIVVESLNVQGMSQNGNLSRAIHDVGWGMFRRMLEYKCQWYGAVLIIAPRDFPSTKACSNCGEIGPPLPLSQRVFRCEACGLEIDRDLNAALNLWHYGLATLNGPTGSSLGSNACGEGRLQGICPVPLVEAGSSRSFVSPKGGEINDYELQNGMALWFSCQSTASNTSHTEGGARWNLSESCQEIGKKFLATKARDLLWERLCGGDGWPTSQLRR
jgi:putative transposase